jgi:YgiT-type zinc finger domain-containing protein
MAARFQDAEGEMNCTNCGSTLESVVTDMPFKISQRTIVILKSLPMLQCGNCGEYLLEDAVMARVEKILDAVDRDVELEIVAYAA